MLRREPPYSMEASKAKKRLSKSVRIHIRRQKARIRRDVPDLKERQRALTELTARYRG